jgi:glycosyltransferase involved in cell wall biosynthesis
MRIAFLVYYFPPDGGAGSQRPASWVRHFPALDVDCTVFTREVSDSDRTRFDPRDPSLLPWIEGARVVRTPWHAGQNGVLDWMSRVATQVAEEHERRPFDLLLVTCPPYELARPAAKLAAARLGIPCVLDLREPWALDGIREHRSIIHKWRALREVRAVLEKMQGIIVQTSAARDVVHSFLEKAPQIEVVANGFEPSDFDIAPASKPAGEFRIVFTGQFLSREAVASSSIRSRVRDLFAVRTVPIQPTGRSPLHLLRAIRILRERQPALGQRIRFHFAGVVDEWTKKVIDRSGVQDAVVLHGQLEHARCAALLKSADALFLSLHGVPRGVPSMIIPGKAFEYLAARRPILAAVPDGDTRELVRDFADGVATDPCDDEGIAAAIERVSRGAFDAANGIADLTRFTRRSLAQDTAEFLRRVHDRW